MKRGQDWKRGEQIEGEEEQKQEEQEEGRRKSGQKVETVGQF